MIIGLVSTLQTIQILRIMSPEDKVMNAIMDGIGKSPTERLTSLIKFDQVLSQAYQDWEKSNPGESKQDYITYLDDVDKLTKK